MSRLRIVDPTAEADDVSMADAIRALIERVIADNPLVVMVAWETPNGKLQCISLPNAVTVKWGIACELMNQMEQAAALAEDG